VRPLRLWTWLLGGCIRRRTILGQVEANGAVVRKQLGGLLGPCVAPRCGRELGSAVDHFVKVSRSYWPGCSRATTRGLPRTNNDLEQAFGSHRYHERRPVAARGRVRRWCCEAQRS